MSDVVPANTLPAKLKELNLRGWRFFILWIVSLSLSTFLTSAINSTMNTHEKMKEKAALEMKELKDSIRTQLYDDEDLYVYCQETKNNTGEFDPAKLEQLNEIRNQNLRQLVNSTSYLYDLGRITPDAYQAIAELTKWNQRLLLSGNKVCSQKLKTPNELAYWKKNILTYLNNNKAK